MTKKYLENREQPTHKKNVKYQRALKINALCSISHSKL